ncbi:MAG: hypothetical protein P4M09_06595 [Devosia sp.]|nr:hypothetical protein [Devosia sp.]
MLGDEPEFAASILPALAERLRALRPAYPEGRFTGRGILIVAGGRTLFTNAYVLVSILRRTLGCRLPIEIWHFGPAELSASMAAALDPFDVRLVDAEVRVAEAGMTLRDGWQLKSFALLWSGFAEVLMLDADQVPISDPAVLFDWPQFRATGAVFWPDTLELIAENPVWTGFGLRAARRISFESGQVLVDKRRHWRALSIVLGLNEEAEQLYTLIYGDKDTFLFGWALAEAEYALVPFAPLVDERCLVQRDFDGNPLFQHRTNAKWNYGGEQYEIEGFQHLDDCLAALDELREVWSGVIFHAPDRSTAARAAEEGLITDGALVLEIDGEAVVTLELRRHGEIGAGRAFDRLNWWCEEAGGDIFLVLRETSRISYRLRRLEDGRWEGWRCRPPARRSALSRVVAAAPADVPASPGLIEQFLRAAGFPDGSPEDLVRLEQALVLLERVEPGVGARLAALAADHPDAATAAALAELAREIPAHAGLRPVFRDQTVLQQRYHSSVSRAQD